MDIQVDFFRWQVPVLKEYLQHRGITCHLYRKHELFKLCKLAQELDLEKITSTNDYEYELSQVNRRTITENGVTQVVCEIGQVPIWSSNLKLLPIIEQCDILFIKKCDWNDDMIASNCTKITTEMLYLLPTLPSIRFTLRNTAPVLIKLNGLFHFYRE